MGEYAWPCYKGLNPVDQSKPDREWRIVALFSFVVVLFCGLLTLILTEAWGNRGIFFLYFLGYTLVPISLYGIVRYSGFFTQTQGMTASGWAALCFNLLFSLNMALFPDKMALLSGIPHLLLAYLLLLVLRPVLFKNNVMVLDIPKKVGLILSAAVCAIGLLGFFNTFVEHFLFDRFDGIVTHIPHWGGLPSLLLGIFALMSAYVLWWRQDKASDVQASWTRWVCFCPLLLFSIQSTFDLDHYDAFVSPAIAVLHGRVPLLDVFSQYGLGYLLFTLAFLVLPNTYAVCASIVSLMNIGTFILYLFMLRAVIKNPPAFCLIGVSSVFGVYFCNGMSLNLLPSALGLRYLPVVFFLYYLIKEEKNDENKLNCSVNTVLLYGNALWSAECLVFYFLIAGFYDWLTTHTLKRVLRDLIALCKKLFWGILVFFLIYYLIFKKFPNYIIYLEHPLNYLMGKSMGKSFQEEIDPFTARYLFFLPVALVSLVVFYCSMRYSAKKRLNPVLIKLFLLNFAGIVFFVYIAFHGFVFFIKFQFILYLTPFLGILFFIKKNALNTLFRFFSTFVLWVICFLFFCVFVTRLLYHMPSNLGVNDALIYHLIHFKKENFENFLYNMHHFCNKVNYKRKNSQSLSFVFQDACRKYDFRQEIKALVDKYFKEKKDFLIFSISFPEVLFDNNKYHPILVNPLSDLLVHETQVLKLEKNIVAIQDKEIVVVDKDLGLDNFQQGVLRKIAKRFDFKKIDETPHLWVFELIKKTGDQSSSFLSNSNYSMYLGANGVVNRSQAISIEDIKVPMYFYHDKVLTLELNFEYPFLIDGIKIWHLLNNRDLLKYRFFSNNSIKTFNVLVSLDGENWTMLASESNYFMNDKKYYYQHVPLIKAKYVRLNALIDSPFIAVSLLEVFGKEVFD